MRIVLFFLGVVGPVAALWVELTLRLCNNMLDPIPTTNHVYLVGSVAVANLLALFCSLNQTQSPLIQNFMRWFLGLAAGIAAFYTVLFVPLLPLSAIACLIVVTVPLGILPLTPLLSLIASVKAGKLIDQIPGAKAGHFSFIGFACGLLTIMLLELPSTVTRTAMTMAVNPREQKEGLFLLRAMHDKESLLRMCYERSRPTDILGSLITLGRSVNAEEARQMYYRVTGNPFNTHIIPDSFRGGGFDHSRDDGSGDSFFFPNVFDYDSDVAGQTVGGVVRGVLLAKSDLQTKVDANSGVTTTDWTMEFCNKSPIEHEARAQILLPPGAVVSQAILWVNGVPQQAAFAGRSETRKAYQSVVRSMRDPLLVTTNGPDRVLIQCFPIRIGQNMKIKLTITAPMLLPDRATAQLLVPQFAERNFLVEQHSLRIQSNTPLTQANKLLLASPFNGSRKVDSKASAAHIFTASISNDDLCSGAINAAFTRDRDLRTAWSASSDKSQGFLETIEDGKPDSKPKKLVLVVDGSGSMKDYLKQLLEVLKKLPPDVAVSLLRSSDSVEVLGENLVSGDSLEKVLDSLGQKPFVGGQDAVPALLRACELTQTKDDAILWIHGPQPIELEAMTALRQVLRGRNRDVRLYDFEVSVGPNRVIEQLEGLENVRLVARSQSSTNDLLTLFAQWQNHNAPLALAVTKSPLAAGSGAYDSAVSLAPIWAKAEINRLLAPQAKGAKTVAAVVDGAKPGQSTAAMKLAVAVAHDYRVITPVSGAVVLETKEDYAETGLDAPPPDGSEVPTRPEPETWMLLIAALAVALFSFRRKRISPHQVN
jgi:hypothetical protein